MNIKANLLYGIIDGKMKYFYPYMIGNESANEKLLTANTTLDQDYIGMSFGGSEVEIILPSGDIVTRVPQVIFLPKGTKINKISVSASYGISIYKAKLVELDISD